MGPSMAVRPETTRLGSLEACHRYARGVEQHLVDQPTTDEYRSAQEWLALVSGPLSMSEAYEWAVRPDCGAVVAFSGTVRDHSIEGDEVRAGVHSLEYEAYGAHVVPSFKAIVAQIRSTWPRTGRIVIHHRVGRMELGESSVLVVVSAPHRPEAFEAARYAIDALKSSSPIWKRETWQGGSDWGLGAHPVSPPSSTTGSSPS